MGGDATFIDPDLKGLGVHGGATETMPPYGKSPVVNVIPVGAVSADGTIALCPTSGTWDQRGMPRPQGSPLRCEIGAVEAYGPHTS